MAANRDEFHARQATAAHFWEDRPEILAGRDLKAGGTWMGVSRDGRFAAVTNYRGATEPTAAHSRGELVTGFLVSNHPPALYMQEIEDRKGAYSGFNLLAADGEELWWMSNRNGAPRRLDAGVYGLGNLLLDSPEVEKDKARFAEIIDTAPGLEPLFSALAPARIVNPTYGTRCSTILARNSAHLRYAERSFAPDGTPGETLRFELNSELNSGSGA
ncbi:MAG: NRDE family protein [Betaproteobacteria bacterium]